jgi:uncharacterized phiE125 gp8 family phage protein
LARAKDQCGVASEVSAFDEWFRHNIAAARRRVEHDVGVVCYTGTFTWKFTEFPWRDFIELPSTLRPVTAVSSITYVDTAGDTQTWSSAEYTAPDAYSLTPFVRLNDGYVWPVVRGDLNGITLTATAGYATIPAIPPDIKNAVALAVHIEWLFKMERFVDAERAQTGYDRWINLLRRERCA